ncbi:MAG: hypothetical protein KGJ80_09695 [Chloroflexota bacterium]|nr:hypothetical protein [Chloroflexota bacterium]
MKAPEKFTRIVNRKRYSVQTATLIADDAFWDGHNFERHGRNTYLYRTPKGEYFTVTLTQWQGEQDSLDPISQDEAIALYEGVPNPDDLHLSEHHVPYKEAFPDVNVEDA